MVDGPTPGSIVKAIVLSYGPKRDAAALIDALCADGGFATEMVLEAHNPASPGEVAPSDRGQLVVNLPVNIGYAGAMNVGMRRLIPSANYLLLLTQDVRITAAALRKLVDALDADSDLAMVGPLLRQDGTTWSAGKVRGLGWQFDHMAEVPTGSHVRRVDSLDGSVLLVRVQDLPAELMNEGFFMYFEETELIERIVRTTGHGVAVVTSATADSVPGWTSRPLSHAYLMVRNGLFVAHRYGGLLASCAYAFAWATRTGYDITRGPKRADTPSARRLGALRTAFAGCVGILHFLFRRMGPPPEWLQDGDLRVTTRR